MFKIVMIYPELKSLIKKSSQRVHNNQNNIWVYKDLLIYFKSALTCLLEVNGTMLCFCLQKSTSSTQKKLSFVIILFIILLNKLTVVHVCYLRELFNASKSACILK